MFKLYFKEKGFEEVQIKSVIKFEEACELAKYHSKNSKYNRV